MLRQLDMECDVEPVASNRLELAKVSTACDGHALRFVCQQLPTAAKCGASGVHLHLRPRRQRGSFPTELSTTSRRGLGSFVLPKSGTSRLHALFLGANPKIFSCSSSATVDRQMPSHLIPDIFDDVLVHQHTRHCSCGSNMAVPNMRRAPTADDLTHCDSVGNAWTAQLLTPSRRRPCPADLETRDALHLPSCPASRAHTHKS